MITSTHDIAATIKKANEKFESAFARGDAAGMANLYTSAGLLMPTGTEIIQGQEAIRNFWQRAMDMGIKEAQLNTLEVDEQGDTAIEMGNYVLKGKDGNALDQGKYLVVWKHQGEDWKLHKDIWNSSQPQIM